MCFPAFVFLAGDERKKKLDKTKTASRPLARSLTEKSRKAEGGKIEGELYWKNKSERVLDRRGNNTIGNFLFSTIEKTKEWGSWRR